MDLKIELQLRSQIFDHRKSESGLGNGSFDERIFRYFRSKLTFYSKIQKTLNLTIFDIHQKNQKK
jgi:hypothetical protein